GAAVNGQAVLNEDGRVFTGFSQTFVVPAGATTLRFILTSVHFGANGPNPPDAFEAALLDAVTGLPLLGPTSGLSNTDAFFHLQPDGQVFFGPGVTVSGPATSGQTVSLGTAQTVTLDLSGLQAGTVATLYFDLLGFGPTTSSVAVAIGTPPVADAGPDQTVNEGSAV